jgi:hypothetical protein
MTTRTIPHSRSKDRRTGHGRSQSRPRAGAAELAAIIRKAAVQGLQALAQTDAEGWLETERYDGSADPTEYARHVFSAMIAGELHDGGELIGALGPAAARLTYTCTFTAAVLLATGGDLRNRRAA